MRTWLKFHKQIQTLCDGNNDFLNTGYRWFELSLYQKLWLTRADLLEFFLLYSHESHSNSCKIRTACICQPSVAACSFFVQKVPGQLRALVFISFCRMDIYSQRTLDYVCGSCGTPLPTPRNMLITECHNSHKHSQSPLTRTYPDFCEHAC